MARWMTEEELERLRAKALGNLMAASKEAIAVGAPPEKMRDVLEFVIATNSTEANRAHPVSKMSP